jgi:hypothetical protein
MKCMRRPNKNQIKNLVILLFNHWNNFIHRLYKETQMFKEISRGFSKFFTKDMILILIIMLILGWVLFSYSGYKSIVVDRMTTVDSSNNQIKPNAPIVTAAPAAAGASAAGVSNGNYVHLPIADPSQLLPKDPAAAWGKDLVPSSPGDIMMPDLLQAGYHIGLDTIGQSLRNANYQLRSDPIIPKQDTGPWLQSTIEPDFGRVPLEIGACSR